MDRIYIKNRDRRYTNRYKLARRMDQIAEAIRVHRPGQRLSVLEIGTADGILLNFLNGRLNLDRAIGIEPSLECLNLARYKDVKLAGAIGEALPFKGGCFDVIVAASVIDHLNDVDKFLAEAHRVLKHKGILVITAVVPFYDKLAKMTGFDKGLHPHIRLFNMRSLRTLLEGGRFRILAAQKFALPSFGLLPFERRIEVLFRKLHLGFVMFYSLIVAQDNNGGK